MPPHIVNRNSGGESRCREFVMHFGAAFGADLLSDEPASSGGSDRKASVHAIYAEFNNKAWGLTPGSIPAGVHKSPPAEIYKPCTWPEYSTCSSGSGFEVFCDTHTLENSPYRRIHGALSRCARQIAWEAVLHS